MFGKRAGRKVEKKEVIMFNPDYPTLLPRLEKLADDCKSYLAGHKRWLNYFQFWKQGAKDHTAEYITDETESIVEELSNSDQILILNKLMDYPMIGGYNQTKFQINKRTGLIVGIFFPVGLIVYFIATYQRKLLRQDIQAVQKVSLELDSMIRELQLADKD